MRGKTLARIVLALLSISVIFVYYVPLGHIDYAGNWRTASFGFSLGTFSRTVESVENPKLLAADVRPGDELQKRIFSREWTAIQYPRPGDRGEFTFVRPGHTARVALVAQSDASFDRWQQLLGVLGMIPATAFLVVAVMLVYLRPGVMTWSFFFYAVGFFGTRGSLAYYSTWPEPAFRALSFVLGTVFGNFAALPLIPFILRFPNDDVSGWRKPVDRFVWAGLLLTYAAYVWQWFALSAGITHPGIDQLLQNYIPLFAFFFSALILYKTYKSAQPDIRQRVWFLVVGMVISFVAYGIYFVPGVPLRVAAVVEFAAILMPITVAYSVLVHRVIDVNFVLNRAIVYGVISVVLLAFVSLLDWLSGRILGAARLTTFVEAAITIGLGFVLNRLHETFSDWVDRLLFWRRHRAEQYLKRVAAALPFATEELAIVDGLIYEPVETLDLTGAALYRAKDGAFAFENAWRASPMVAQFDANDNLVRFLQAEENVVWLDQLTARSAGTLATFSLAVPVIVRHELIAIALYGAHRNGSQIDPEEVQLFQELAVEAARAYDHVEAVRMREEVTSLRQSVFKNASTSAYSASG